MPTLTIGEVARRGGVPASTIRYYESIALLPAPARRGGQRRYDPAILERLAFIAVAQRLGFSLAEIGRLFHNEEEETPLSDQWRELASRKLAEIEQLIAQATGVRQLLAQGLRCGCADLCSCIDCVVLNCAPPPAATVPARQTGA